MRTPESNGRAAPAALPDWATKALNGSSMRIAKSWALEDLEPGDFLAGTVVQLTGVSITIAIEAGSHAGEALEPGEWRRVRLASLLKSWIKRDGVEIGEQVAISFRGRVGGNENEAWDLAAGVFREPGQRW